MSESNDLPTTGQPAMSHDPDCEAREQIRAMVTKMQEENAAMLLAHGIQPGSPELERQLAWARWAGQIKTATLRSLVLVNADFKDEENPWKHIFMEVARRLDPKPKVQP